MEPYFNETGSNCPSILPGAVQNDLCEMAVRSVQVSAQAAGRLACDGGAAGAGVCDMAVRSVQVGAQAAGQLVRDGDV